MKKMKLLWVAALMLITVCQLNAQEKYSKLRIPIPNAKVREEVFNQLEIDHYLTDKGGMLVVVSERELQRLQQSGIAFEVLVDDVVKHSLEENAKIKPQARSAFEESGKTVGTIIPTPVSFGTGGTLRLGAAAGNPGYFTYAEMLSEMQALVSDPKYSNLITLFSIGNSYENRPIWAVKISDNVSAEEGEPEVLYTALQHAREAIGGTSMIFFMQYLLENYSSNQKVKELVDNRAIYIVPCVNPDGYTYNYGINSSYSASGGGMQRKNRRPVPGGSYTSTARHGVDLNRNYGVDWSNCTGASASCGSDDVNDDTYYGPAVFSEPETQAVRAFVQGRNFIAAIDQHCYGSYYSLPYGRPNLHPALSTQDKAFYTIIPALMGKYNGHRAGNSPETVNYEVAGGIKDWLLMGDIGTGKKGKVYGMTGEAGGGDFWAPVSQIIQHCKELCFQNLQLALAAGAYYDVQDNNELLLTATSGSLSFRLRRIGLTAGAAMVSIAPLENIATVGAPVTVSSLANYNDTHNGSITYTLPTGLAAGQRIRYAWKVTAGGITVYDTVVKIYAPTANRSQYLLFEDNIEAGMTKWTGSGDWVSTTSQANSGTRSMTATPNSNYLANSVDSVTSKTTLDLSNATAAYLSFWVQHRAENFRDKLQVQVGIGKTTITETTTKVKGNNVTTYDTTTAYTWTAVAGKNTVQEANTTSDGSLDGKPALTGIKEYWTHELIDLSSFKGQSLVKFQFKFSADDDAGSNFKFKTDDGFYIDDVQLVKTSAALITLPVHFRRFTARPAGNQTVALEWVADTDAEHSHFEVERSVNGSGFETIGRVGSGPLQFRDLQASSGANYYRIKQVDKNGSKSYSQTLQVLFGNTAVASVYPNPAESQLQVQVNSGAAGNIGLQFWDMAGRMVHSQSRKAVQGVNQISVNLGSWKTGVYLLKVVNSRGEVLTTQKISKQ